MKIDQAVILAGGRGERLRPLTDKIPKPMVPVNGVPFLDYLINSVVETGIEKILVLVGYKSDVIIDHYRDMTHIDIEFSKGTLMDQTGRRLLDAYDQLDSHFLLMYGDNYWAIEFPRMCSTFESSDARISTTVFSNKNGTGEYGFENNVLVDEDGLVNAYDKQRESQEMNGVDIGYFLVEKSALDRSVAGNVSFEMDILPGFIENNQLVAHVTDSQYYYVTDTESLKTFECAAKNEGYVPLPERYFGANS